MKIKFRIEYVIVALLLIIVAFANIDNLTTAPSVVCTAVYDPVCGIDGITYSNDCYASAAGAEVDYEGECVESSDPYIPDENDKPNLLLMLVILIGLSFIVMVIVNKKGK